MYLKVEYNEKEFLENGIAVKSYFNENYYLIILVNLICAITIALKYIFNINISSAVFWDIISGFIVLDIYMLLVKPLYIYIKVKRKTDFINYVFEYNNGTVEIGISGFEQKLIFNSIKKISVHKQYIILKFYENFELPIPRAKINESDYNCFKIGKST